MNFKKASRLGIIWSVIVFVALFVFFTAVNPLTVYDTDDWLYIGQFRRPVPMIGHWNPIKVFPETFMPLMSFFGVKIIQPFIHNYSFSLTLAHGLFGSLILTLYFVEFSLLFYRKKLASLPLSIGYGMLFILLHFITYIHGGSNNIFLVWAQDLTCFYNYTLAAALNASLVMRAISMGGMSEMFKKSSVIGKVLCIFWVYFAIFSNLYSSIILAAYIGTELLVDLISLHKKRKFKLLEYCKGKPFELLIIICWFISNYMETTGGRAGDLGKNTYGNIPVTVLYTLANFITINVFITLFGIAVGILWIRKNRRIRNAVIKFTVAFALLIIYLVLLSATADPHYIYRAEVVIGILFYIFMALIACFNELVSANIKNAWLLLILSGTIVLMAINPGKLFFAYNNSNISYKQCEALIDDFIEQFKTAQEKGYEEVSLIVPAYDVIYNWPIADFAGDNIAIALYNHKVIDYPIKVKEIVPSRTKNQQFGINEFDLEENLQKVYY